MVARTIRSVAVGTVDVGRDVLSVATLPGIVLHELAHALGCVLVGAELRDVRLWTFPAFTRHGTDVELVARVSHEPIESRWRSVVVSLMPLPVCGVVGSVAAALALRTTGFPTLLWAYLSVSTLYSMGLSERDAATVRRRLPDSRRIRDSALALLVGFAAWDDLPLVATLLALAAVFRLGWPVVVSGLGGMAVVDLAYLVAARARD